MNSPSLPQKAYGSMGLTRLQRRLLDFLSAYQRENGFAPSYAEMMKAIHLSSTSGIYRLVHALVERGRIIGHWHRAGNLKARSIEVVQPIFINGKRYRFIPRP